MPHFIERSGIMKENKLLQLWITDKEDQLWILHLGNRSVAYEFYRLQIIQDALVNDERIRHNISLKFEYYFGAPFESRFMTNEEAVLSLVLKLR